jgi:hypothetical protein
MSKSRWYYDRDGQVKGPLRVSELRQLAANGELQPTDRVRTEEMDRWVKARAVKGLFASAEPTTGAAPAGGDSMFDFLGAPPMEPESPAPVQEFIPAFDFFGGAPPPAPPKEEPPPEPPPSPPPRAVEDSANFTLMVPMATPVEPPVAESEPEVPMALPASAVDLPPPKTTAELTGPEVTLQADGSAQPTGAVVELSVTGGWLSAKSAAPSGEVAETWLRLGRLEAASLRDRPGAGLVLSFHAGSQTVAVQCDGDSEAARAFLRRVAEAAG